MERIDFIQSLIIDYHNENREDHASIHNKLDQLRDDLSGQKIWRARITGIAAAVSTGISAAAWVIGHFWLR